MPPLRFRLRTLLIAVAIVGVISAGTLWGIRMNRLSRFYRQLAAFYAQSERYSKQREGDSRRQESDLRRTADWLGKIDLTKEGKGDMAVSRIGLDYKRMADEHRRMAESHAKWGAWHAELKRKYLHAARYPWLPVQPDPPPPEPE